MISLFLYNGRKQLKDKKGNNDFKMDGDPTAEMLVISEIVQTVQFDCHVCHLKMVVDATPKI
jgi:hypothetical protein